MDAHGALVPHYIAPGDSLVAIDGNPVAAAPGPAVVFALLAGAAGTLVTLEFRDAATARRYQVVVQRHTPLTVKNPSLPNCFPADQNDAYHAAGRGPTVWEDGSDTLPDSWTASPPSYSRLPLEQGRATLSQSTASYFTVKTEHLSGAGSSFSRSPAFESQQEPNGSPPSQNLQAAPVSGWYPSAAAAAFGTGLASSSLGAYLVEAEPSLRRERETWSEPAPVRLSPAGSNGLVRPHAQAGLGAAGGLRQRALAAAAHVTQL